jgi:hypothetical protein
MVITEQTFVDVGMDGGTNGGGGGMNGGGGGTNEGAIAGGVVGGISFIIIASVAIFCVVTRRRRRLRLKSFDPSTKSTPWNRRLTMVDFSFLRESLRVNTPFARLAFP